MAVLEFKGQALAAQHNWSFPYAEVLDLIAGQGT